MCYFGNIRSFKLIWVFLSRKPKGSLTTETIVSLGICDLTIRIRSCVQRDSDFSHLLMSMLYVMDGAAHREG